MKDSISICIESLLSKYGQNKWRNVSLTEFKIDVEKELNKARYITKSKALKASSLRLLSSFKKSNTIEEGLNILTDFLFKF